MNRVPETEQELLRNARAIAGFSLQQLANEFTVAVPDTLTQAKGWTGNLLELALGAPSRSMPQPDFVNLGIELKTLPVIRDRTPKESTYVCVVQLEPAALADWQQSLVRSKLSKVLWIPYEADEAIPIPARRIGNPILWSPTPEQENQLRTDWQELTDMIVLGDVAHISASMGTYLQIRPKAANARMLTRDRNQPGRAATTLPRGFYLRTALTRQILAAVPA